MSTSTTPRNLCCCPQPLSLKACASGWNGYQKKCCSAPMLIPTAMNWAGKSPPGSQRKEDAKHWRSRSPKCFALGKSPETAHLSWRAWFCAKTREIFTVFRREIQGQVTDKEGEGE